MTVDMFSTETLKNETIFYGGQTKIEQFKKFQVLFMNF
jgi:hypothetical protein